MPTKSAKIKIPTITFNQKYPFRPHPQRPFIMELGKSVYRYGNRYNVCTDIDQKTVLVDMVSCARITAELIREGQKEYVVVNGKKYPLNEVLISEEDLLPQNTLKE